MTIHGFGNENEKVILLIHPSVVKWDYYPDLGHAGLVLLKPELFAEKIRRL